MPTHGLQLAAAATRGAWPQLVHYFGSKLPFKHSPTAPVLSGGVQGTGRCTRGVEVGGKFMEATGANLRWRQFPRTDPPSMLPHMIVFANK